ncbi:hypothetical protein LDENG_00170850 [Lucifuga dentata]|nr:hypothetical protein LDENG_00170850 [Lucifuga dentata]
MNPVMRTESETSPLSMVSRNSEIFGYILFKGPYRPFCMFGPNIFNFHTHNVVWEQSFPKAYYWKGELKMFFLPSRPPLVSVHSGTLLKSTC